MDKGKEKNSIDINAVNELFLDLIFKDDIIVIKNMVENGFNIDNFYFEKEYGINAIIKACFRKFSKTLNINESLMYLLGLESSKALSEDAFSLLFAFGRHNSKVTKILKHLIENNNINSERVFVEMTDTDLCGEYKDKYIEINSKNLFKYKGFNPKLYVSAIYAYICKDDLIKIDAQSYCVVGSNEYNLNENPNLDLFKMALKDSKLKLEETKSTNKDKAVDRNIETLDFLKFCELIEEFEDADIVHFSKIDRELGEKLEKEFKAIESKEFNSPEEVINCMELFMNNMKKELSNIKKSNENTDTFATVNEADEKVEVSNDINEVKVDINEEKQFEHTLDTTSKVEIKDSKEQKNNINNKENKFLEITEIEALVRFKNLKDGSIKEEVFVSNSVKDLELNISEFEQEFTNSIVEKEILSKNIIDAIENDEAFTQELIEFMKNKGRL